MKIEKIFKYKILPKLIKIFYKPVKLNKNFFRKLSPKRIILIKIHHKIGDLILGTPVFRNLSERFPYATIDFLAGEYNAPAILNNIFINKIYIFKKPNKISNICYNIKLVLSLQKIKYDIGIIFSASSFSVTNSILGLFIKPKILIGLKSPEKLTNLTKVIYNYEILPPAQRINETRLYLKVIEPFIKNPKYKNEEIHLSSKEKRWAFIFLTKLLRTKNLNNIIGIHPGGTYFERRWPVENYIELIRRIPKNYKILLFTGKTEDIIVDNIIKSIPERKIYKLPSYLNFRQICAIQNYLCIFIGNDTGTLHSAAGVGVKSIGIYTSTNPKIWAPLNKNFIPLINPNVKKVLSHIF